MLIHSNEDHVAALVLEEVTVLFEEMKAFSQLYGPDKEDLEEDDEAALLLIGINLLAPASLDTYIEAIKLLSYFLAEHCWQEEPEMELRCSELLDRAKEILPAEKRHRRSIRKWMLQLDEKMLRAFI
ncbi:hypothetical protein QWY22_04745 [Planococcus liqunii]|uniref:Immunity protein 30 domain-containing protein n=1 Tax=Planococcus liqunii TaxID=3058394 RepID=A0ABT8MRK0_9BACL|nr:MULTISPECIES: hypothetical protein [unclassified Planococcus (in: firmicutes)]MDN7227538.1 hypothetical protein [Planococcus sp. N064]WKA51917.1 hypothetical protein QWY22_04745 [Planococcus sp. N056]